jgi:hypothetical protein
MDTSRGWMGRFFATIDTAVMGRKTFDAAKGASFGGRDGVTFVNESPDGLVSELQKRPGENI